MFFFVVISYVNVLRIGHEKSRDKRLLVAKLKSFGYRRHFVRLLNASIYVIGVYSTAPLMSNLVRRGVNMP